MFIMNIGAMLQHYFSLNIKQAKIKDEQKNTNTAILA